MASRDQINHNINQLFDKLEEITPQTPDILAVTKYASIEETRSVVESGRIHLFGENRFQDSEEKINCFPDKVWHFIGRLQSNKVSKVVGSFCCIQSVDSMKLANRIGQVAQNNGKEMPVLVQINAGEEEAKSGFSLEEIQQFQEELFSIKGICIEGIMVVAPIMNEESIQASLFRKANKLFEKWQQHSKIVKTLSMGMSNDFHVALREGATMIRVGSILFKEN